MKGGDRFEEGECEFELGGGFVHEEKEGGGNGQGEL